MKKSVLNHNLPLGLSNGTYQRRAMPICKGIRLATAAFFIFVGNASADVTPLSMSQSASEIEASDLPSSGKASSTAIIEKTFTIESLGRERKVRIYLPPNYQQSQTRYPVIYMHDGQNLFDDKTSYAGEWHVDETLNKLSASHDLNVIVVGIDNGGEHRMNELSPWPHKRFGNAEGAQYLAFITNTVKPYIDNTYRTLADAQNTAMIGSSMGGLMTHYAALKHPDVFGKAGIFSPSYWFSKDVFTFTDDADIPNENRFFITVGGKEGESMVPYAIRMTEELTDKGLTKANLFSNVVENQEHNEAFWTGEFEQAVIWLFKR